MKTLLFTFLSLFLINGSDNFVRCACCLKKPQSDCLLCNQTPYECEELASDCQQKISLRKLINFFLKKTAPKSVGSQPCDECNHCRHSCVQKNKIYKVLEDVLKKASCAVNKEECIKEIILKLIHPSSCEGQSCNTHCDPVVQKVLKSILKKAAGCGCKECPCDCIRNPPPSDRIQYKYWFRTSKEALTNEIENTVKPRPFCEKQQVEKEKPENLCCACQKKSKKPKPINCSGCQRPDTLICPRYITGDCPSSRSKSDTFSICADCSQCYVLSSKSKHHVALYCSECKAVNPPFVQFTRNGYPFRLVTESHTGIQIRTKFLQINDFWKGGAEQQKTVFNPFHPICNIPRKKKGKQPKNF